MFKLGQKKYLIRILDDDPDCVDALVFNLSLQGWNCIGYTDAEKFLLEFDPNIPGCIILDIKMPNISGLDVQERLRNINYQCPIIFLTAHGNLDLAVKVFIEGACHFLQKPVTPADLYSAVNRAITIADTRRQEFYQTGPLALWDKLTSREKEVVKLVALGITNREIGERLGLSERTVEAHRWRAQNKLNITKKSQLVEMIAQWHF